MFCLGVPYIIYIQYKEWLEKRKAKVAKEQKDQKEAEAAAKEGRTEADEEEENEEDPTAISESPTKVTTKAKIFRREQLSVRPLVQLIKNFGRAHEQQVYIDIFIHANILCLAGLCRHRSFRRIPLPRHGSPRARLSVHRHRH